MLGLGGAYMALEKILGAYYYYTEGKRKEDDISVRKRIMSEIKKSRTNLTNIMEEEYLQKNMESVDMTRKTIDELDVFMTEVDLSEMGHHYPFFSIQKSADKKSIEKLIEYDKHIIDRMINVTEATLRIHDAVLAKEDIDIVMELKKVRQYISNARNSYKDRRDFIKGLR